MKIRDSRKRGWFWSRNEIFDWWGQTLGPQGITTYLCLCRHSNENAESHPSFARIAAECGMHRSTAIKAIQMLTSYGLIHVEPRINAHGDPDSNTYTILDIPHPLGVGVVAENDYPSRPQLLGVVAENDLKETNKKETNSRTTTTTPTPPPSKSGGPMTAECGSGSNELIYPKELLPKERERATRMLEAVNGQAQQLLDELAGQLKAKEIKNPLGYLRGLIAKAREGKFLATAGIKVGEIRKQRARIEASIKASEERASKPLEGRPRREGVGKQLEELRKLRKSLGATAHL